MYEQNEVQNEVQKMIDARMFYVYKSTDLAMSNNITSFSFSLFYIRLNIKLIEI